ncbi:NADPH2:quinone reductase [Paucimonas lemoignei]|uniref:NADPH2:quinone reductase n=1 Tax=Paucimonas lemoignei TaxID=29443 RepID=A0A4R3HRX0_PAULE|nr:NADPH:quinone reductase [Paucimonas lemoignei]TCS34052.1 NADPH2:quinone reductase [Paucimonas lemoignei]
MKAAWYEKNGSARETLIVGELPTPEPGPGEVRVKISVSGVNPSDVKSRRGRPLNAPRIIPHSDAGGVIDAVGPGVSASRIGERVWIWNGQWQRPMGTAAEYIALPEAQAVTLPDNCDFAAAACLGIPALTAYEAVRLLGDIQGKTILLIGAASSVAHYAAQFAALKGAKIIGTVSSDEKARHALAAGVNETINYKTEPVAQRVKEMTGQRGVDAIIDMDFSSTVNLVREGALIPHGKIVCYGSNSMDDVLIPFRPMLMNSMQLLFFLVYDLTAEQRQEGLAEIGKLLASGRLTHTIGARYSLDDIAAAHEAVEGGRVMGNVVVDIG